MIINDAKQLTRTASAGLFNQYKSNESLINKRNVSMTPRVDIQKRPILDSLRTDQKLMNSPSFGENQFLPK